MAELRGGATAAGSGSDAAEERIDIDEVLARYDRESAYRRLRGPVGAAVALLAIAFSVFQLYTAAFGVFDARIQRAVHLAFGMALVYLLYPARRSGDRTRLVWWDVALALAAAASSLYLVVFYQEIVLRAAMPTRVDIVVALAALVLVLEATRRVVGWPIVIIGMGFIAYALAGRHLPGFFAHRGFSLTQVASHLYFTTEGIFGIPLGVSSTFIFLFILFGAFLEKTGIGRFFIDLANAVAGWASGGPAKVAVITSALEGTISGSSVANTVGSGSFTIPMMKRLGYRPEFAAAVEAAASTGGQIMPPVMGAAAFLMAEFTGIPYIEVAKSAAVPALLYFTGIFIAVHYEAKRLGLRGLPRKDLPGFWSVLASRGHLFLPLVGIIWLLLEGSTPMKAAFYGIVLAIGASMVHPSTRMSWRDFVAALEQGAKGALGVVMATAAAGIIIGVVTLTGLGLKLASGLVELARGNLLLTMLSTMVTSLILGMGVPTTANYVITSTIAAPALLRLGVPLLAAHMFVFYFGVVADITPPVALAAYAGSGIAGSNPMRTGVIATRLAVGAFLVPYIFVMSPVLLLQDVHLLQVLQMTFTSLAGMFAVAVALGGFMRTHLTVVERVMLLAGGVMMIDPGLVTDLIGVGLMAAVVARQWLATRGYGSRSVAAAR
ncbi:TRAP transporter permease [Carboxydochorda subterranea]|uniref:TRAP transporter permease n=1 Tax=Carboxydichorda subterranea TaxID=3109565 RepID=A0ABZ1BV23_9FIRM|nr:TRAP transporter permease [Limnochorda sp. L945t]WRP16470.1 TRAP transporter permease [Limnochorda sp. L945t]